MPYYSIIFYRMLYYSIILYRMPYLLKDFELAVTAVKEKRLTPTQASRKYGVPRKTVDNHARYKTEFNSLHAG